MRTAGKATRSVAHIEHWSNGGETKLNNLVRLCHFHHVAVHEGGFDVRSEDERPTFYDPDGCILADVAASAGGDVSVGVMKQLEVEQRAAGVEIDQRTSLPRCHGLSHRDVDIDGCVNALIRRSGYDGVRPAVISAER